jgi:hypothetical protein
MMKEDERIAKLRKSKTRRELEEWLKDDITLALQGPKREELLAFLRRIQEEDKNDPAVYRIQLLGFSSKKYYADTLLVVEDIIQSLEGNDIEIRNYPEFRLIEIAFRCNQALHEFSKLTPFCSGDPKDSYKYVELRRNPQTHRWERATRPIMQG